MNKIITMDMLRELNDVLIISRSALRLEYDGSSKIVTIKLKNDAFISNAIVNPNEFFYEMIDTYFKGENIELLFNNTSTMFWAK